MLREIGASPGDTPTFGRVARARPESEESKLLFQEQLNLFEHALRCGVLLQREVVLSLQCYEVRAGNSSGKLATRLERRGQ
jgi:hypothetical protein